MKTNLQLSSSSADVVPIKREPNRNLPSVSWPSEKFPDPYTTLERFHYQFVKLHLGIDPTKVNHKTVLINGETYADWHRRMKKTVRPVATDPCQIAPKGKLAECANGRWRWSDLATTTLEPLRESFRKMEALLTTGKPPKEAKSAEAA